MSVRILITAFEAYDHWTENSSWLTLVEFTKQMRNDATIVTRRYPVDFAAVRSRLAEDLAQHYDFALHLGQAPGAPCIELEAIGLNVGGSLHEPADQYHPIVDGGPAAYLSDLPLGNWVRGLRSRGMPATLSYHAGTFLCNATLYLTQYLAETRGLPTKATFVHLPLDVSQVTSLNKGTPSYPASDSAKAIDFVVEAMIKHAQGQALV